MGDDARGKEIVLKLIDELGFDGLDAGTLADSWRQQPGTPAYARDLDRPARGVALAQGEAGRIAEYRKEADDAARAWFQQASQ